MSCWVRVCPSVAIASSTAANDTSSADVSGGRAPACAAVFKVVTGQAGSVLRLRAAEHFLRVGQQLVGDRAGVDAEAAVADRLGDALDLGLVEGRVLAGMGKHGGLRG